MTPYPLRPVESSQELNIDLIEFWLNEPTAHAKTVYRVVAELHIAALLGEVKRLRALASASASPSSENGDDYQQSLAVLPDSLERPLVARIGILLESIRRESKIGCELRRELDGGIERDAKAIEEQWPDAAKFLRSHAHIEDGV